MTFCFMYLQATRMASDETFRTGVFGFMCFIIVFGLAGNTISFIVWTFGKHCNPLPVSTYFRFLAFIDTFILTVPGVELLLYLAPFKLLLRNQNIVFCKCLVLLTTGTLRISSWTLVILSIEKTLRIFLPLKMQVAHMSSKWRTRIIFCILILASLGMNIPNTIHSTMIDPPRTNTTESNVTQDYTAGQVEPIIQMTTASAGDLTTYEADALTSTSTLVEKLVSNTYPLNNNNDLPSVTEDQFTAETTVRHMDENNHSHEETTNSITSKGDPTDGMVTQTTIKDISVTGEMNVTMIVTQDIIMYDTETSQTNESGSVTRSTIRDMSTTKLTTTILNSTQEANTDNNETGHTADSGKSTARSVTSHSNKISISTVTITTNIHQTENKTSTKLGMNFTGSVLNQSATPGKKREIPGLDNSDVTTLSLPVSVNTKVSDLEQKSTESKVIFNIPYCSFVPTQLEIFLDMTLLFFIPFTVFLICNTCILCRLFRRGHLSMGINDKQNKKRKLDIRNMTYHVVGLCIIHTVSTAPWSIWTIYRIYHVGADVNDHYFAVYDLLNAFAYLNSAGNVVLYCLIGKDFRRDLKHLFIGKERKNINTNAEDSCRKCEESTTTSTKLTKYTSRFSICRSYELDSPSSKQYGFQTYTKK